ncbi:hypothetical protein BKA70DRAFT_378093 [Coprinopsis sp. MPI-PUGE-AT-0042]|nr:hypothetical protein BKA70DRAFT_378093 [Coprinopsis sp. MPI-PUGE-AT-0042]
MDRYLLQHVPLARVTTYVSSLLWGFQACLAFHAFTNHLRLSLSQRRQRSPYLWLWGFILFVSFISYLLFLREPYVPLMDARSYYEVYQARETVGGSATTAIWNAVLSLISIAFMVWRATIVHNRNHHVKWFPISAYLLYTGSCVTSVYFQIQGLIRVASAASAIPGSEIGDTIGADVTTPLQKAYQWWQLIEWLGSVGVSTVCSTSIFLRLISMRMKRTDERRPLNGWITTVLLESALPFTLVGVVAVILGKGLNDPIVFATPGPFESPHYSAPYLNHLLNTLRVNALVIGPQLILFRIIKGTTWTSSPTPSPNIPTSPPYPF